MDLLGLTNHNEQPLTDRVGFAKKAGVSWWGRLWPFGRHIRVLTQRLEEVEDHRDRILAESKVQGEEIIRLDVELEHAKMEEKITYAEREIIDSARGKFIKTENYHTSNKQLEHANELVTWMKFIRNRLMEIEEAKRGNKKNK